MSTSYPYQQWAGRAQHVITPPRRFLGESEPEGYDSEDFTHLRVLVSRISCCEDKPILTIETMDDKLAVGSTLTGQESKETKSSTGNKGPRTTDTIRIRQRLFYRHSTQYILKKEKQKRSL